MSAFMHAHVQTVIVETVQVEPRSTLPFAFVTKAQYGEYRRRLWLRDPNCTYCKKKIAYANATLDHILPKSKGGLDTPANLILCCERCNQAKDARSLVEWAADIAEACVNAGQVAPQWEGGVA